MTDPVQVVIVDDEPAVLRITSTALQRAGFSVQTAASGDEALSFIETHEPKPRVLLTDVCMPGMDGIELAARVGDIVPGVRIVFMTGATTGVNLCGPVVLKPFRPGDLVSVIQKAAFSGSSATALRKGAGSTQRQHIEAA